MGKQLIPSLEKGDVVIMDNMRSHHVKIVTELLDKSSFYKVLEPDTYTVFHISIQLSYHSPIRKSWF